MWWRAELTLFLLASAALPCYATYPTCSVYPVTPAPSYSVCDQEGKVLNGACIDTSTVTSQTACRDKCLANSACLSFSYAASSKKCSQYKKRVMDSQFQKCSTGVKFWERTCSTKTCTCPNGKTLCGGTNCIDTKVNRDNCGRCGNRCPASDVCVNGACVCGKDPMTQNPRSRCGSLCVDKTTDHDNCGQCDLQCASDEECSPSGVKIECDLRGCCYCDGPVNYSVTRDPPQDYVRTYSGRGLGWPTSNWQAFSNIEGTEERACDAIKICAELFIDNSFPHFNLLWDKRNSNWYCIHSEVAAEPTESYDFAGASLVYAPAT